MKIKFTFLVLAQEISLHEFCLSPQSMLDVLEQGRNLGEVFKEFLDVTGMVPKSSDHSIDHLFA